MQISSDANIRIPLYSFFLSHATRFSRIFAILFQAEEGKISMKLRVKVLSLPLITSLRPLLQILVIKTESFDG